MRGSHYNAIFVGLGWVQRRSKSSKTFSYNWWLTFPYFSCAHSEGASSFRKIPRYLTAGGPCMNLPAFTNRASLWATGSEAGHAMHVGSNISYSAHYAFEIIRIYADAGDRFPVHHRKAAASRNSFHITSLANSNAMLNRCEKKEDPRKCAAKPSGSVANYCHGCLLNCAC